MKKIFFAFVLFFGFMSIGHTAAPQTVGIDAFVSAADDGEYLLIYQYGSQKYVKSDIAGGRGGVIKKDFKNFDVSKDSDFKIMIIDIAKWKEIYSKTISSSEFKAGIARGWLSTEKSEYDLQATVFFKK